MMMLAFGVNTEIFVPYFLQVLHGMTPLHAGYISAVMSAGWTTGSVLSSGGGQARVLLSMRGGPLVMAMSIALLSAVMPVHDESGGAVAVIGLCLAAMGFGIGFAWPHLGPRVFAFAADNEKDVAAASDAPTTPPGSAIPARFVTTPPSAEPKEYVVISTMVIDAAATSFSLSAA